MNSTLMMFKIDCLVYEISNLRVTDSVAVVNGQQWVMVFRGASGDIGGANNIFTLWNSFGTSGENVPCAISIGSRCSTHYKNKLVDNWNKMIIHKVNKRALSCFLHNKMYMHLPLF